MCLDMRFRVPAAPSNAFTLHPPNCPPYLSQAFAVAKACPPAIVLLESVENIFITDLGRQAKGQGAASHSVTLIKRALLEQVGGRGVWGPGLFNI